MNQLSFDFEPTLPAWAERLAVFDLETTGLELREARIVTACALEIDSSGNPTSEVAEWLVNPGIDIPIQAASVHGVTTEIAQAKGQSAASAISEILAKLRFFFEQNIPVVAYNAPFDFTILHFEALRYGLEPLANPMPIIDPLVIDKYKDTYRGGKRRLENAAEFYRVPLKNAHNATADAIAAGRVAQAIARRWSTELPTDPIELHKLQVSWSEANDKSFEDYMRRVKDPSFTVVRGWPLKA
ncbi:exonuclease domain-containing protein [Candidatus Rhodoluna planktonica]|uniref:exonuclease domain-containing protein n=1 Tax=Candidatus Rhodoluna planktonica TaxID=535712 RepID=UPI000A95DC4A|nr:exonuclease domain-containing protein [Candidatus Rhodoluna planktonica]